MARKSFDDWFLTFGTPIDDYEYYTDFSKVCKNIDKLKLEIYMLNSLEGSKNIEDSREANISYYGDMRFGDIEEKWNVDLSAISDGRTSTKRFEDGIFWELFK